MASIDFVALVHCYFVFGENAGRSHLEFNAINVVPVLASLPCFTQLLPGDLLEIAQESLEAQGYRVVSATKGKQALEALANNPNISLLVSDVVMPGELNGYELAEQASEKRLDLKVLLTSGYTEKTIAHDGRARFQSTLLSKPYAQSELITRVREILDDS